MSTGREILLEVVVGGVRHLRRIGQFTSDKKFFLKFKAILLFQGNQEDDGDSYYMKDRGACAVVMKIIALIFI